MKKFSVTKGVHVDTVKKTKKFTIWGYLVLLLSCVALVYSTVYFIQLMEKEQINTTLLTLHIMIALTGVGLMFFSFYRWGEL